jgi:hypothetical protein
VLLAVGASALLVPVIQARLQHLFPTDDKLQGLCTLFVTVGGALLGATAIVSSLVLFSMQVNVERMPHGLFRRLSGDRRLLGAFAGAYVLAVSLTVLSMLPDVRWAGAATFGAGCAVILILLLFLYSYRRALGLINPMHYRPVTSTCMEQLAGLDFNLLRGQSGDISFAVKQVRDNVSFIAKFF